MQSVVKSWIQHPPIKDFEGRQVRNDRKEENVIPVGNGVLKYKK